MDDHPPIWSIISLGHSTALNLFLIECLNECTTHPALTNGFNHLLSAALAELAFASSPLLYLGKAKRVFKLLVTLLVNYKEVPTNGTLR